MSNPNDGPAVTITTDTLKRLRRRIRPGDRITFITAIIYSDTDKLMHNRYQRDTGTVLKKYPHLVRVENRGSRIATVAYRDIVSVRRGGGRDG